MRAIRKPRVERRRGSLALGADDRRAPEELLESGAILGRRKLVVTVAVANVLRTKAAHGFVEGPRDGCKVGRPGAVDFDP